MLIFKYSFNKGQIGSYTETSWDPSKWMISNAWHGVLPLVQVNPENTPLPETNQVVVRAEIHAKSRKISFIKIRILGRMTCFLDSASYSQKFVFKNCPIMCSNKCRLLLTGIRIMMNHMLMYRTAESRKHVILPRILILIT